MHMSMPTMYSAPCAACMACAICAFSGPVQPALLSTSAAVALQMLAAVMMKPHARSRHFYRTCIWRLQARLGELDALQALHGVPGQLECVCLHPYPPQVGASKICSILPHT